MKFARVVAAAFAFFILLFFAATIVWFVIGGREKARHELVTYLQSQLGSPFDIQRLSIYPGRVVIGGLAFDPSPALHISVRSITARYSFWKSLLSWPDFSGAIQEIELSAPRLTFAAVSDSSPGAPAISYQPFALKRLQKLSLIRQLRIIKGSIVREGNDRFILDNLSGLADLTDPTHATLNLTGDLSIFPGAKIEVDGNADLFVGTFLVTARSEIPSLEDLPIPGKPEGLELKSGRMEADLEAWGGSDVRFGGSVKIRDLAISYQDKLQITDGEIDGNIFGQRVDTDNRFTINGLPLEARVSSNNIFAGEWEAQLTSQQLDLSDFDGRQLGAPEIAGRVIALITASGKGKDWTGKLDIRSNELTIAGLKVEAPRLIVSASNSGFDAEQIAGRIAGGDLSLAGKLDPKTGDLEVQGNYSRAWKAQDTPVWSRTMAPRLAASVHVARKAKTWSADGAGYLYDVADKPLLALTLSTSEGRFFLKLAPPHGGEVGAQLTYSPKESNPYLFTAHNPQEVFAPILKPGILPEVLLEYDINLKGQGDGEQFKASLDAVGHESGQGITVAASLIHESEYWRFKANTGIRLTEKGILAGDFVGRFGNNTLEIEQGSLSNPSGAKLLNVTGSYNFKDRGLVFLHAQMTDLPLAQLLRLGKINMEPGFDAHLNALIDAVEDTVNWSGSANLIYPDSVHFTAHTAGRMSGDRMKLDDLTITNFAGDTTYVSAAGAVNWTARRLDSAFVSFTDFPVGRVLEVIAPGMHRRISGRINARIEATGNLPRPKLFADIHLTNLVLNELGGFWANIRIATGDTLYRVEQCELGRDVSRIADITGWIGKTGTERLHINGRGVDISQLVQAVAVIKLPIFGPADLDFDWSGGDQPRHAEGTARIVGGAIGPVPYDMATAHLSFVDIDGDRPSLIFDTLSVLWGNAQAGAKGELPLTADRSIAIRIQAQGCLTTILPRLDEFFSRPEGNGQLSLQVGGTINDPRFLEGSFSLADAGIRMREVLHNARHMNADIKLTPDGKIRIKKLQGTIDDVPVMIGNREPDASRGEAGIIVGGYDLGVLQFQTGDEGIWIVIPGLMEPEWGGHLQLIGTDRSGPLEYFGPASAPRGVGLLILRNTIFTYPLLPSSGEPSPFVKALLGLLERTDWDVRVIPERGCRYIRDVSGLGDLPGWESVRKRALGGLLDPDVKLLLDLRLDDNPQGLRFMGSFDDTLRLQGDITSSQGTIELLDMKFDVDQLGLQFNPTDIEPFIYGTAQTTVIDSGGVTRQIRLRVHGAQTEAGVAGLPATEESSQPARFADFSISLEDDQGHSQEQILALLGYTPEQIAGKLSGVSGRLVQSATPLRKWTRLLERQMEQLTGLDRFAVETNVAQNLIERQIYPLGTSDLPVGRWSNWSLFGGSRVTLGKYIFTNLYLSYTGSLANQIESYNLSRLGVQHDWDIQYRLSHISNNLTLNYRYEYNGLARSAINSMLVRYSFIFTLQDKLHYIYH